MFSRHAILVNKGGLAGFNATALWSNSAYQQRCRLTLSGFNTNILIKYFNNHNVTVEWISETLSQSFENELVEDMLSLLASFSSKIYGKRSAENKRNKKK